MHDRRVTTSRPTMAISPADLRSRLGALTLHDEQRLRRRLDRARRPAGAAPDGDALAALADEVARAEERVRRRRAAVPEIGYPASLPIAERADDVLAAIRDHQVVIVAGETGSGKSTQLPKMCLALGRGVRGMIGHTQPRRLAARTVAARVAEELGGRVGDVVGYSVRFSDQVGDRTLVKLMTDGILLAEMQRDRLLRRYDTIIVDEAHERSLNIDFLLGYLTNLLPRRPDLKVVVTSATIDTERFARHFDAPVVEVSGRTYPVDLRYRPLGEPPARGARDDRDDTTARGPRSRRGNGRPAARARGDARGVDQIDGIRRAVDELRAEGPGDILVFLSGEREIRDTATALGEAGLPGTEILPLYARLSAAEQQRAFQPHPGRRIVLATNVAETSITVPGVRYVVDPGTARISRYSRRTKVQRLPIEPVSQASADQRAGRCGRVAPGICIRLYAEDDYDSRPPFTEPEILRTNLASVVLQMAALGLGDVESFPFVDPPDAHAIRDAVALLVELGAMTGDRELTGLGRRLARLPVDPRFGRMILEADRHGCVREVLVIAAGLSIQDVRERPTGLEAEADELHARFADPDSDFVALLNLWRYLEGEQRARSSSAFRRMCRAEHLHHVRVREWQDLVRQLREVTNELGIRRNTAPAEPEAVHRSLLAGLLSHVGMYDAPRRDFLGARQTRFVVAPGSVLHRKAPAWVMAGELVETNRLLARMVARIDPGWIEPLAEHLVRRSYGEPAWVARRAAAMTSERVTLYGLPIVDGRRVPLSRLDPATARRMFIEHALVAGDWAGRHAFVDANRALLDEVAALEERARRRDLLVDDAALVRFFDARLGRDVTSGRHFERWWRQARERDPDLLTFTLADLIEPGAAAVEGDAFPTTWHQGDLALDVSYTFGPGAEDDGVTVHVPLVLLNRVRPDGFDWQVPGHRLDLVVALVRSLPKPVRRRLVPVPDRAREALDGIGPGDGPLAEVLARRLATLAGERVTAGDFDLGKVPGYLRVRFAVEDRDGAEVAAGRDLAVLQRELGPQVRRAVAAAAPAVERRGLVAWDIGTLPRVVQAAAGGPPVQGYPALVDEGETAGVRVMATATDQARAMAAGTRRLLLLAVPAARREAERRLRSVPALAAARPPYPGIATLADDCVAAAADRIVAAEGGPAWDTDGFGRLAAAARARLTPLAAGAAGQAADLVAAALALEVRLAATRAPALRPAVADMRAQCRSLVVAGFVSRAGLGRLRDIGRYLDGIGVRLDKLGERADRDRALMARVRALEDAYLAARDALPPEGRAAPAVVDVAWLLEELRIGLFAQVLGTARPVSEQRVVRALARLGTDLAGSRPDRSPERT
ncbi:MAG TPA: ATP-dependent RNA helicase HrpA [Acidimicrobiales bacterium]|nr:ATP-dependent RNA helicase HrpA [Acidimicrobiales bacterium]